MARIKDGNARNMSVRRINASSHRPPSHPAAVPAAMPNPLAAVTTVTPETTEMPRAIHHAAVDIAAKRIQPERVGCARTGQPVRQVLRDGVLPREPRRGQRD